MTHRDTGLVVAFLVALAAGLTVGARLYLQRQRQAKALLEALLEAQRLLARAWEAYNALVTEQEADKERMREIEMANTEALIEQGDKSMALLEAYQGGTLPSKAPGLFKEASVAKEYTPVGLATLMMHYPEAECNDDAARIEKIMMERKVYHEAVKLYAARLFGYTKEKLEDHIHVNNQLREVVTSMTRRA